MKQLILITVLLIFSTAAGFAQGFYFGAGIGNTYYNTEIGDAIDQAQEVSENSTSWKIFVGIPLNNFLNIEGGYRTFGNINVGNDFFESKISGFDVEALGRLKVSMIDIFAKAGVMFWTEDYKIFEESFEETGTDFLWGIGAGVHFGSIGVRAEWESIAIGDPNSLSMVSLSATLGF